MADLLTGEPQVPSAAHTPPSSSAAQRRHYELDWLRALIILALVPSHAVGFFTATTGAYFGTQYASPVGLSSLMIVGTWGMALLFLVAGAATYSALGSRSPRQFIGERFSRLLIPFVFASLTLVSLQNYLIIHTFPGVLGKVAVPPWWDPRAAQSAWTFSRWFAGGYLWFLTHYTPQYEFIFWSHLWFIPRLLVISLLLLPLLRFLRRARGVGVISWLASQCVRHRGAVFLLAVPLGLINAVLGWQWQGWQVVGAPDAANVLAQFTFYAVVYLYGYVLYADERLRQAVRRDGGVGTLAAALLIFVVTQLSGIGNQALAHDYSAQGLLAGALHAVATWLCIVSLTGLGMRFLAFTSPLGQYLTEAAYPFYVVHLLILYLVGLPLLASRVPAAVSFLAMVVLTLALTLAAYELLIRHIPPMRALFGMRGKPSSTPA